MKERYGELDPHIRTFLEGLDASQITELRELLTFHSDLPPHSREMLRNMDPKTAEWLRGARPDEIGQLVEGIRLVRSFGQVGTTVKWIVVTVGGFFFLASTLSNAFFDFVRWIKK